MLKPFSPFSNKPKLLIAFLCILLLCLDVWPGLCESEENLLYNPSFEELDGRGMPAGWYT